MTTSAGIGGPTAYPEPLAPTQQRQLYRSRSNRTFAGVCGGLAEYYGADPSAVRLATVVIGLLTGVVPLLIVYLVAAIVIPERPADGTVVPVRQGVTLRPGQGSLIVGAVLIVVGGIALVEAWFGIEWDQVWPFGLIAIGALLLVYARRT